MSKKTYPVDYKSLAEIGEFVAQAAKKTGFKGNELYKIETAVDEACSNIIEHAYHGGADEKIVINVKPLPDRITIQISDFGLPFDLNNANKPDVKASLDERENHGLGIYFIKEWMDLVDYKTRNGINTLTLVKFLKD